MIVEAAVDTLEDALAATADGVDRIELCGPLHDGGTTPATAVLERCLERLRTPVHVLIRPRAGDFAYSPAEVARMRGDIETARAAGAAGVAVGALTAARAIDVDVLVELLEAARPMRVVFHRAFDHVRDQFEALEILVSLGVDLILTSGTGPTAIEGADRLRALVDRAGDQIGIIAAGSITQANVRDVIQLTGVTHVHGRAFRGLAVAARSVG